MDTRAWIHGYGHTGMDTRVWTHGHWYTGIGTRASVHPSIGASVHPSIGASVHPCIHPSLHPCIHPSLRPCIHPSLRPCIIFGCPVHHLRVSRASFSGLIFVLFSDFPVSKPPVLGRFSSKITRKNH